MTNEMLAVFFLIVACGFSGLIWFMIIRAKLIEMAEYQKMRHRFILGHLEVWYTGQALESIDNWIDQFPLEHPLKWKRDVKWPPPEEGPPTIFLSVLNTENEGDSYIYIEIRVDISRCTFHVIVFHSDTTNEIMMRDLVGMYENKLDEHLLTVITKKFDGKE